MSSSQHSEENNRPGRDPQREPSYSFSEDEDEKPNPWIPRGIGITKDDSYVYLTPRPSRDTPKWEWAAWRKASRIPFRKFRPEYHIPLACELNGCPELNPFLDDPQPGHPLRREQSLAPPRRETSKRSATSTAGDQGRWVRREAWDWVEPPSREELREWKAAGWQDWSSHSWEKRPSVSRASRSASRPPRRVTHSFLSPYLAEPREPSHSPPPHLRQGEAARGSRDPPPEQDNPWGTFLNRDIRDPSTFGVYHPRAFEIARGAQPPVILEPKAKTTRHPVAKSSALLRASQKSALRRGWSRSRLNRNSDSEYVEVEDSSHSEDIQQEVEVDSLTLIEEVEEKVQEEVEEKVEPPEEPPSTILSPPPPPARRRLRVGLDFHNVIQIHRWIVKRDGRRAKEFFIPQSHVDAIRRLARSCDTFVYSYAGVPRFREVTCELQRCGITDIIGADHIVGPPRIKERVGKCDDWTGHWRPGKAEVCVEDHIDILVDDSPEIGEDARYRGLRFIGVHTERHTHFGGVDNLIQAIDSILNEPRYEV
jgi:hypothetical protein